jgi:hypothetical protein
MGDKKVIGDQDGVKVTERHYGFLGDLLGMTDYRVDDENTGKYYNRDRRDDALEKARELRNDD